MAVEIIHHEDEPGGVLPWSEAERDSWYVASFKTTTGTSYSYVKRTGHAAAVGRALLTQLHERGHEIPAVAIWERDGDVSDWPFGVLDEDGHLVGMVELPRVPPLAVVTDTADPEDIIQEVEKAMETATIAQRIYNAARAKLLEACEIAHDYDVSANTLARMVNGVVSRPTLLKELRMSEQRAAAEEA